MAWVAEKYIDALEAGDSTAEKHLIPIEGFDLIDTTVYVHMFRSEAMVVVVTKIKNSDVEKFEITNLSYCIDLQRNPKGLVDRIANAKVYMSKQNNKLLIEIIERGKTQKFYFVNKHKGYFFNDFLETMQYLNKKYK